MSDRPEDSREDRRRTGPLGDDGDAEETRQVPAEEGSPEATRRVPTQETQGEGGTAPETRRIPKGSSEAEDKETRVIRTPGYTDTTGEAEPYPRGYFEAAEDREERLRDMYGGVDWLASFLGLVFSLVLAAVFSTIAGLVLVPLGFPPNLGGGQIGASVITGLVLLAILIFLIYFFGGYVAGRLARFDGGRNGAMLLVWSFTLVLILALAAGVFSGFLPAGVSDSVGNLVDGVLATVSNFASAGIVGIIAAAGALLVALLGGFLGGRLGSRYHTDIDRTS